jgi:hypothetical protein
MVRTKLAEINHAASWLETTSLYCHKRAFGGLRFHIDQGSYAESGRTEKLVRLLAPGKPKLDVSGIDLSLAVEKRGTSQDGRLFRMSDAHGDMYVQRALEETVVLGTTARKQGRKMTKVVSRFQALLAQKMPLKHLRTYNRERRGRKRKRDGQDLKPAEHRVK